MPSSKGVNTAAASVTIREERVQRAANTPDQIGTVAHRPGLQPANDGDTVINYPEASCEPLTGKTSEVELVVIHKIEELREHAGEISTLATSALEPNIFYDPCMLLPGLETYGQDSETVFLLVYIDRGTDQGDGTLIGFFPFEFASKFRGLPIRNLRLWRYPHCFLATPLLQPDFAERAVTTALEWARAQKQAKILDLPLMTADNNILKPLKRFVADYELQHYYSRYDRAMMTRCDTADDYLSSILKRKRRKDFSHQFQKLSEEGDVKWQQLSKLEPPDRWINEFLELESSGWKGQKGTALICADRDSEFFRTAVKSAHREGRLTTLSLLLDDQPIAMIVLFLSGTGAYALKMAYAEKFRRFSPGFQMTIELIRRIHGRNDITWMDFCADPDHTMSLRLLNDRKPLINSTIAMDSMIASKLIQFIPMIKSLKSRLTADN